MVNMGGPPQNLIPHLKNSTASLVAQADNGAYMTYCGAVWVTKHHLVTAKHCVADNNDKVEIGSTVKYQIFAEFDNHFPFSENTNVYVAKVIAEGAYNEDIALLYTSDNVEHGIATMATYDPRPGQVVHHVGHPKGLQFSYILAYISETRMLDVEDGPVRKVLNIVGFPWYGSSGGPGFDAQGNLIGICSMLLQAPGQTLFVHTDVVRSLLDDNDIKYHTLN